jgi:hypothetical protein
LLTAFLLEAMRILQTLPSCHSDEARCDKEELLLADSFAALSGSTNVPWGT